MSGSRELLYEAARLYYDENRPQHEIAEELGVSRSKVSRLLAEARRAGIVRIEIVPPATASEIADDLAERLGLAHVVLTPSVSTATPPYHGLGDAVHAALRWAGLARGGVLLVSWSRTLWEVARRGLPAVPGVTVVPAMGGLDQVEEWFATNVVVRRFAAALEGTARQLYAPAQPSPELRRVLDHDPQTQEVVRLWNAADVALTGIGAPPNSLGGYGPVHVPRDPDELNAAVGDVASRYFDLDGHAIGYSAEPSLFGISRDQLRAIPHRVGVASGGEKVASIIGAARAGLTSVLVTDARTAEAVLWHLDRERRWRETGLDGSVAEIAEQEPA